MWRLQNGFAHYGSVTVLVFDGGRTARHNRLGQRCSCTSTPIDPDAELAFGMHKYPRISRECSLVSHLDANSR
jgi:hypothetical protein